MCYKWDGILYGTYGPSLAVALFFVPSSGPAHLSCSPTQQSVRLVESWPSSSTFVGVSVWTFFLNTDQLRAFGECEGKWELLSLFLNPSLDALGLCTSSFHIAHVRFFYLQCSWTGTGRTLTGCVGAVWLLLPFPESDNDTAYDAVLQWDNGT